MTWLIYKVKQYGIFSVLFFVWYYFWGHILGAIFYEKKYYYGKWFKGKLCGLAAPGWKWICLAALGKFYNPRVPWPCSPRINIGNYKNIHFHPDDINNFQGFGNYFQTMTEGHIYIGYGCWIAPNVCIITTNHSLYNLNEHAEAHDVKLGDYCWIGANSVILPGVELGEHTVVGAGSVVTKSFKDGYCVLAGNPANKIKELDRSKFVNN